MNSARSQPAARRFKLTTRILFVGLSVVVIYLVVAYVVLPFGWERYARRHPAINDVPGITETKDGIPGDPINVALVGTRDEVTATMAAAKWNQAAALGIEADLKIAADTVLSRPDVDAPVSSLYLFGRKEDLAFEQPVGNNPRHRHHVRFWKTEKLHDDRPIWVGSAIYDQHVGFSRDTGQITHVTRAGYRRRARQAVQGPRSDGAAHRYEQDRRLSQNSRRPQWRRRPLAHGWKLLWARSKFNSD